MRSSLRFACSSPPVLRPRTEHFSNITGNEKRLNSRYISTRKEISAPECLFHLHFCMSKMQCKTKSCCFMCDWICWNRFHCSLRIKYCLFLSLKHYSCIASWPPMERLSTEWHMCIQRLLCPAFKFAAVKTKYHTFLIRNGPKPELNLKK